MSRPRTYLRGATATAIGVFTLIACGGHIDIGTGNSPITTETCPDSACGPKTFTCGSGAPTHVTCGRYQGQCAWTGACPGDCTADKCAKQAVACAAGSPTDLRCVPSPNRGVGSAPADQCDLTFRCNGDESYADASADDASTNPGGDASADDASDDAFAYDASADDAFAFDASADSASDDASADSASDDASVECAAEQCAG